MALGFAVLIFFIIGALISLFLTFVCISAWNKEKVLFGHTITPFEARCFIGFGLFGAVYLMPVFLAYVRQHDPLQSGSIMLVVAWSEVSTSRS